MNTRYERMSGFSLKLMAMIAGALMAPVFAAPPPPTPFHGAFVEGAIGGSSGAVKLETVTHTINIVGETGPMNSNKSKSAFAGRVGVGYGYDLPYSIGYTSRESGISRQFNLTGMLTYSPSQKVSAESKIKNSVGLLFQPGYYLPLKSTPVLIYGTVGYAWASFDQRERVSVTQRDLRFIAPQGGLYNSPLLGGGNDFRAGGLALGLGAKYAITGRLYAGFDYTHTAYQEKTGTLRNWQDQEEMQQLTFNTDWRVKFRTDTFLLTVGYRFF